jgi:hypothetical protein
MLTTLASGCQIGTVSNSIFCDPPISTRRAALVGAVLAEGSDAVVMAAEAYIRPVQAACGAG